MLYASTGRFRLNPLDAGLAIDQKVDFDGHEHPLDEYRVRLRLLAYGETVNLVPAP